MPPPPPNLVWSNGRTPFFWPCYCICTTLQEEFGFCSNDILFGTPLKLPGEFFCDGNDVMQTFTFVNHSQSYMKTFRHLSVSPTYIPKGPLLCPDVFVRSDSMKSQLHLAYSAHSVLFPGMTNTLSLKEVVPQTLEVLNCWKQHFSIPTIWLEIISHSRPLLCLILPGPLKLATRPHWHPTSLRNIAPGFGK